ncbi:MAG: hypothetical protein AABY27_01275, partial [Pseudomonadota bacterium]
KKILASRPELATATSINRLYNKQNREEATLIGIVIEKSITKNNHILFSIEDITGTINVLVSQTKEDLYIQANKINKSLIRIESDEIYYPLHIILRYKIEKALLSGDLLIDELPIFWNEEIYKLFGTRPKNLKEGVLQDIHWAWGEFGYFPTYTLGAILAAQIETSINKNLNMKELIKNGEFKPIIDWLVTNIHSKGSLLNSDELIKQATGESLNVNYFKEYLAEKYITKS